MSGSGQELKELRSDLLRREATIESLAGQAEALSRAGHPGAVALGDEVARLQAELDRDWADWGDLRDEHDRSPITEKSPDELDADLVDVQSGIRRLLAKKGADPEWRRELTTFEDRVRQQRDDLRRIYPSSLLPSVALPRVVRSARPREGGHGRARRPVGAGASSSDGSSGEPGEPALARLVRGLRRARGLAVCPLCCDEPLVRARCWFCGGLGFVSRGRRNRFKRGWRP